MKFELSECASPIKLENVFLILLQTFNFVGIIIRLLDYLFLCHEMETCEKMF